MFTSFLAIVHFLTMLKMSFIQVLIFALHSTSVLSVVNDPLLACYICMEGIEQVIAQKCDENQPEFHSCVFTEKRLLNWNHVKNKSDSEVTFKCLLLQYDDVSSERKSLRGCVAEYPDYNVCHHLKDIVRNKKITSCEVCTQNYCNLGLLPNAAPGNSHHKTFSLVLITTIVAFS